MYDHKITYYCVFPGGSGPTSLKWVADKIYALGKKMHDENRDNQDGANDDESPNKEVSPSIDQGGQAKELGAQKAEDSLVNGDDTSEKEASPPIDQGHQLENPAEHNTDSLPVVASPEQGEKENSTLETSPLTIASKIKQVLDGKNEKYGVVQALDPHSLDQKNMKKVLVVSDMVGLTRNEQIEKWEKENGEIDTTCAPEEYSSDDITWYTPSPELPGTE